MEEEIGDLLDFEHLKRHQDNNVAYEDLARPAQLNVDKDGDDKIFLDDPPEGLRPTRCPLHFLADPVSVMVSGSRVTKRVRKRLTDAYNGREL